MKPRILVVDDEPTIRHVLRALLTDAGFEVRTAGESREALEAAAELSPDLVLLDLRLGDQNGIDLLDPLHGVAGARPLIVLMTAHGTIRSAVEAMKKGAYDYITKPFDNEELQVIISRALEHRRLHDRVGALESQLEVQFRPENVVAQSSAMEAVFQTVRRIAPVDTTVLVAGESGTGKELVARAIHRHSARREAPFVAINCGAIPTSLLESTFFGHEKGAFTDAKTARRGAFEQAEGGTLFLDEIGELQPAAQASLLRALEAGEIRRVGAEAVIHVNVRVIAATNRDLAAGVAAGAFREDLYWRLNVVSLHLPPLRDRTEEVPALVDHFVVQHAARMGLPRKPVTGEALALLLTYGWPGNVRELRNVIESALVLAGEEITARDLPPRIAGTGPGRPPPDAAGTLMQASEKARGAVEARMIREALTRFGGNRSMAAASLGISRKTLFNKLRDLDADPGAG
jgi:two-component system, NtrC family, response regulator HydG